MRERRRGPCAVRCCVRDASFSYSAVTSRATSSLTSDSGGYTISQPMSAPQTVSESWSGFIVTATATRRSVEEGMVAEVVEVEVEEVVEVEGRPTLRLV